MHKAVLSTTAFCPITHLPPVRPTQSSLAKSTADKSFKSFSARYGAKRSLASSTHLVSGHTITPLCTRSRRTSGRYQSFTQSMDLGPALRGPGYSGFSGIPRHQSGQQSMPPPPPPGSASSALVVSKPGGGGVAIAQEQQLLQRQLDAAMVREAELQRQRHHMEVRLLLKSCIKLFLLAGSVMNGSQCSEEPNLNPCWACNESRCPQANLHALRSTCDELTRGLSAARSGLESEREYQAKLQMERDELAGAVERLSSQMSDLQVSGSVAITTSEVCKVVSQRQVHRKRLPRLCTLGLGHCCSGTDYAAVCWSNAASTKEPLHNVQALTKAWTGAMDAIGGVQELQSQVGAVTAVKEQLQVELHEARGQLTESRAQLQDAQGQLRVVQSKAADTRAQLQEAQGRLGDATARLQGVQAELGAAQEQLRERERRLGALEGKLQQEEGRVRELEARLARNSEEMEQLLGKLCSTEDQVRRVAGSDLWG